MTVVKTLNRNGKIENSLVFMKEIILESDLQENAMIGMSQLGFLIYRMALMYSLIILGLLDVFLLRGNLSHRDLLRRHLMLRLLRNLIRRQLRLKIISLLHFKQIIQIQLIFIRLVIQSTQTASQNSTSPAQTPSASVKKPAPSNSFLTVTPLPALEL